MRIDIAVNVAGQADVLLPEDDPVAGEEHEKPHEAADAGEHQHQEPGPNPPGRWEPGIDPEDNAEEQSDQERGQNQAVVAYDHAEVSRDRPNGRRRCVPWPARLPEEKQDHKEHGEDKERRNPVNILDTQMAMSPGGEQGPEGAADVDH